jgi:hypothetical protein
MTGTPLTVSDNVFHIHIVIADPTHDVYSVKFWTTDGKMGSDNMILVRYLRLTGPCQTHLRAENYRGQAHARYRQSDLF